MTQLEHAMASLHGLFTPWLSAPHGTVIWEPEESDPNAQFKRDFIAKAYQVLAAGDHALSGSNFKVPKFGEAEFDALETSLANDPEERSFFELAAACESVVKALGQPAA